MLYVEVSTLTESNWSGIANVTANLCRQLLSRNVELSFFQFDEIVKPAYIRKVLQTGDGLSLRLFLETGHAVAGYLSKTDGQRSGDVAIFPNFRRSGEYFGTELLIVHDLSFILTPELHQTSRITDYMRRIFLDAHSMDRVVCVSESTRRDLISYYGVEPSKVFVSHLGVDVPPASTSQQDSEILEEFGLTDRRYFLALGTIEPRKNIDLILDLIKSRPELLDEHCFVFVGRNGWGKPFVTMCQDRELSHPGLLHFGYVSDSVRSVLLRNCTALLFCSWFEGFGLPIIEAMKAGTIVVGSRSSSLVEAGGEAMVAFDPTSVENLSAAVDTVLQLSREQRRERIERGIEHVSLFTWDRFTTRILDAICSSRSDTIVADMD